MTSGTCIALVSPFVMSDACPTHGVLARQDNGSGILVQTFRTKGTRRILVKCRVVAISVIMSRQDRIGSVNGLRYASDKVSTRMFVLGIMSSLTSFIRMVDVKSAREKMLLYYKMMTQPSACVFSLYALTRDYNNRRCDTCRTKMPVKCCCNPSQSKTYKTPTLPRLAT